MWRNNNPGNLRGGKGAIGKDKDGFAIFPDLETGRKAQADLLRESSLYKGKTIKEMVPIYAPASDGNDVPGYTKDIGDFSGLDINRKIEDLNEQEYEQLMNAIRRREGAIDKDGNPLGVGTAQPGLSTIRPEPRPQPNDTGNIKGQPNEAPPSQENPTGTQSEQKGSEAPADPRAASLVQMASAPITDPGRAAVLKPVEKLTESEMKDMIDTAQSGFRGWRSGDPLKAHLYEKVQDWHVNVYGDGPQATDGGKPIDPTPIRPIDEQPSPHTTPQGEDLWQATGRIGQKVADAGALDGFDDAVKGLQRGLNILNQSNPLPQRSPAYAPYTKMGPVDEDGKYGPQTDFALKQVTARLGAPKVEEAFALGRFNTFARNAQRNGNPEGLEDKTHSIFGPLFRNPADGKAPKIEGGVLQETLNDVGPKHHDDWEPLKVDNWIGPKTADAFGKVLKAEDADTITGMFGRGLGLL
jgi:hypothetical protein